MGESILKNKKLSEKFALILIIIISSPLILFGFIVFFILYILPAPIEKYKYKKSLYYKELNIKYDFGITHNEEYIIYNCIRENNIDIVRIKSTGSEYSSYFKINKLNQSISILIPWFEYVYFDRNKKTWMIQYDENRNEPIELEEEIREFLSKFNIVESNDFKILIEEGYFDKEQLNLARQYNKFVLYDKKDDLIDNVNKLLN